MDLIPVSQNNILSDDDNRRLNRQRKKPENNSHGDIAAKSMHMLNNLPAAAYYDRSTVLESEVTK